MNYKYIFTAFLLLFSTLFSLGQGVRPDTRPLQNNPTALNWEFYSQKDGTPLRRAHADSVGRMFRPDIYDTISTVLPTGNPASTRNRFVTNFGDSVFYVNFYGNSLLLGNASGGVFVPTLYTADGIVCDTCGSVQIANGLTFFNVDSAAAKFEVLFGNLGGTYFKADYGSILARYFDLSGDNDISVNPGGIKLQTTNAATRAIEIITDTLNITGSFDESKISINNYSAIEWDLHGNYVYIFDTSGAEIYLESKLLENGRTNTGRIAVDCYKSEKGVDMNNNISSVSVVEITPDFSPGGSTELRNQSYIYMGNEHIASRWIESSIIADTLGLRQGVYWGMQSLSETDDNNATLFLGKSNNPNGQISYLSGYTSFALQMNFNAPNPYNMFDVRLEGFDSENPGAENWFSMYDSSYVLPNDEYFNVDDTKPYFMYWINNGMDGGFMNFDSAVSAIVNNAPNIYNLSSSQTSLQRYDTIPNAGFIEFRSLDRVGTFLPVLKVSAMDGSRPTAQGWYFNDNLDSLLLYKTGAEQIILDAQTNPLKLNVVSGSLSMDADSLKLDFGILGSGVQRGDILGVSGPDASDRKVINLEGVFKADQLSWGDGGSNPDVWVSVKSNRTSSAFTTSNINAPEETAEIMIDGAGGGAVDLNFTPSMPDDGYTTYRYIYNLSPLTTTVQTNQSWQFRDITGDLGTSFTLLTGEKCKLVWRYDATAANARFYVIKL